MEKIVEDLTLNQCFQFAIHKDKKKTFVNFDGEKQNKNTLKQTAVLPMKSSVFRSETKQSYSKSSALIVTKVPQIPLSYKSLEIVKR